jgi:hypothetical protein
MHALAETTRDDTRVYLTGGATATLYGWREATIDVDMRMDPERDDVLRELPIIKERLHVNVELASPADFIPVKAGWESRSPFVKQIGSMCFYHYDLSAQALAKIERGHDRDIADVRAMLDRGLVKRASLRDDFEAIYPLLYRYPAIDPQSFRRAVAAVLEDQA